MGRTSVLFPHWLLIAHSACGTRTLKRQRLRNGRRVPACMHDVNAGDAAPVCLHHDDLRYCLYLLVVKMWCQIHVYNVLIDMIIFLRPLWKNVFNVRQFVRVCTLMVKGRSSIYARTFSRPLDLYDHYRQDDVAWIYMMSEGSLWLPNVENLGAQFRRSCTEGVCISLYLLVALQLHVLGVSIVNRKKFHLGE